MFRAFRRPPRRRSRARHGAGARRAGAGAGVGYSFKQRVWVWLEPPCLGAYVLSLAVLLMTGATLGDRLGRKRLVIAGMGLFVAARPRALSRGASAG
jgi:MFS family permease